MAVAGGAKPSRTFWRGKRVFLTGHTGFKGGWMSLLLRRMGAELTGFALPPNTDPDFYSAAGVADSCQTVLGDLRDADALTAALAHAQPEIVFHLAAQALVGRARQDPAETFAVNVMGTVNLLEAVRAVPSVRAVVIVTSDKVYDNVEWAWPYRETDTLGAREPYGASKACTELVVDSYRHSFFAQTGTAISTVRAGNIIGGGDWADDRLVPDAMRAFARGDALMLRNPLAVRPWQHVLEPVVGYCRLAELLFDESSEAPASLNFGPMTDDAVPVQKIADALAVLWGDGARWEQVPGTRPYEAKHLRVDNSLAQSALGWKPRWRLDAALERTVAWYKQHGSGRDMRAVSEQQIDEFLDA